MTLAQLLIVFILLVPRLVFAAPKAEIAAGCTQALLKIWVTTDVDVAAENRSRASEISSALPWFESYVFRFHEIARRAERVLPKSSRPQNFRMNLALGSEAPEFVDFWRFFKGESILHLAAFDHAGADVPYLYLYGLEVARVHFAKESRAYRALVKSGCPRADLASACGTELRFAEGHMKTFAWIFVNLMSRDPAMMTRTLDPATLSERHTVALRSERVFPRYVEQVSLSVLHARTIKRRKALARALHQLVNSLDRMIDDERKNRELLWRAQSPEWQAGVITAWSAYAYRVAEKNLREQFLKSR